MTLTADQLDTLQVLVMPEAWAYQQALPQAQQVDLDRSLRVRGDIRLVAADVLDTAAAAVRAEAVSAGAEAVTAFEVGPIKLKFTTPVDLSAALNARAANWAALAAGLRSGVASEQRRRSTGSVSVSVEAGF